MPDATAGPPASGPAETPRPGRGWSSRRVVVRDESMAPALRPGDRLLVDRRAYRTRPPRVGEIVVVLDPEEPARWLVKRVAAVGPSPPPSRGSPADRGADPPVPDGSVFLLSDAPGPTRDSRRFGPVPIDRLVGRAYRRYFPADRRGEL
jgi:signal peptidase I